MRPEGGGPGARAGATPGGRRAVGRTATGPQDQSLKCSNPPAAGMVPLCCPSRYLNTSQQDSFARAHSSLVAQKLITLSPHPTLSLSPPQAAW